jgi:hypothetical protein
MLLLGEKRLVASLQSSTLMAAQNRSENRSDKEAANLLTPIKKCSIGESSSTTADGQMGLLTIS